MNTTYSTRRGRNTLKRLIFSAITACCATAASAHYPVDFEAEAIANFGSGSFAPYYIASNRHGILTQSTDALIRVGAHRAMERDRRFSYAFGAEFIAGYTSASDYARWDQSAATFHVNRQRPALAWIQQLYGEIKYRGVFLSAGLKQHRSALLNFELSSGDLTESGNARPIPEIRAGFIDFQDIPLTNGWVQIQGEISYGKFTDNNWIRNHYNYYNDHICTGSLYTYKRCYFRTSPSQPFSLTIGMQAAGVFGGTTLYYRNGSLYETERHSASLKSFFKMFIPMPGGEDYYTGNSVGNWDVMGRYRFSDGTEIKAYMQSPWETGSGIGKLNGFDGLWGVEYKAARHGLINGAVVEYLDFTNQSGPIHWDPANTPGTNLTATASGGDNYYNNGYYNAYANYGMSIGSPFLRSPLYNLDGYMAYIDNRVRGFHIGVTGDIGHTVRYRILGGYRKGWGTGRNPRTVSVDNTSVMIEGIYSVPSVAGLDVKAQLAMDRGTMYGDTFGACISVSYNKLFDFKKR